MKTFLLSAILIATFSALVKSQYLDTTFGTVTHPDVGSYFDTKILADGKAILSGNYDNGTVSRAIMLKLGQDGALDTSFGTGGKFTQDLQSSHDYFESFSNVTVQSDGKLVFLYATEYDNGVDPEVIYIKLMKLNANGTVDTAFNNVSWSETTDEDNVMYGILSLPSGKFLGYGDHFLRRFNADGTLDTTYGTGGTRTIVQGISNIYIIGSSIYIDDYLAEQIIKLPNESATPSAAFNIEGANEYEFNGNFYIHFPNQNKITKLDSNLMPVPGFGTNGSSIIAQPIGSNFTFQPQGSIITSSNNYIDDGNGGWNVEYIFNRINPNGTFDTTFGNNGVYSFTVNSSEPYNWGEHLAHPNGKLYHLFYSKDNSETIFLRRSNLPVEILATSESKTPHSVFILENPVKDMLHFSEKLRNASIYNTAGSKIMTFEGSSVLVSNIKSGVYLIEANNEKGTKVVLKFIKK